MSEQCQSCGDHYEYVYRVPNSVWEKIAPVKPVNEYKGGGLLCIRCAEAEARNLGIQLYFDAHADDWPENMADQPRDQLTTKDRQIAELRWELDHLIEMYSHWFRREPLHGSCKDCGLPQDHKIHL